MCHVQEAKKSECAHEASLHPGHLDGTSIGHMLIDGGASINILPLLLFKKLGHVEGDLKRTNLSLSGFAGDPTEAKGIICKEVTVGSKNRAYDLLCGGPEGMLQRVAQTGLDTHQRVCPIYSSSMHNAMDW
jgi:hypothetical protein